MHTYVETGQTFGEFWAALTDAQRHTFLLDNNVKALVHRGQPEHPATSRHVCETYDAKTGYAVTVEFSHLATLLPTR